MIFVHFGSLVALGNASVFAIEQFDLPETNVLKGLKSEEFHYPGSILRAEPNEAGHPLLYGLPPVPAVFFARNAAFETQRDFEGTVLLRHPRDGNPLLSGYILHAEKTTL